MVLVLIRSHHRKHRSCGLEVSDHKKQHIVNNRGKYGNKEISIKKIAINEERKYENY